MFLSEKFRQYNPFSKRFLSISNLGVQLEGVLHSGDQHSIFVCVCVVYRWKGHRGGTEPEEQSRAARAGTTALLYHHMNTHAHALVNGCTHGCKVPLITIANAPLASTTHLDPALVTHCMV